MTQDKLAYDSAFEMSAGRIRYGKYVTTEVGMDIADLGALRVMIVADPALVDLPPVKMVEQSLRRQNIDFLRYDGVRIEPNQESFEQAAAVAKEGQFDAFVAVGGGSTIDTAKAANLYSTWPAEFLTYVNKPFGAGEPPPGKLKPLFAIPTTAGTGSETTGVAICDLTVAPGEPPVKTGIAHPLLRPTIGLLDPENTRTTPAAVSASCGADVLCHALESFTALPFDRRPRPGRPSRRPNYQGANPISDIWAEAAIGLVIDNLPRVLADASDDEARGAMLLAASYAGLGFGNAGVHLCHALSYPIATGAKKYFAPGYPGDHAFVPHGIAVAITAPAVFEFLAPACFPKIQRAAIRMEASVDRSIKDPGGALAERLRDMWRSYGLPINLSDLGFTSADISTLAAGAMRQERLLALSPRPVIQEDLQTILARSC